MVGRLLWKGWLKHRSALFFSWFSCSSKKRLHLPFFWNLPSTIHLHHTMETQPHVGQLFINYLRSWWQMCLWLLSRGLIEKRSTCIPCTLPFIVSPRVPRDGSQTGESWVIDDATCERWKGAARKGRMLRGERLHTLKHHFPHVPAFTPTAQDQDMKNGSHYKTDPDDLCCQPARHITVTILTWLYLLTFPHNQTRAITPPPPLCTIKVIKTIKKVDRRPVGSV